MIVKIVSESGNSGLNINRNIRASSFSSSSSSRRRRNCYTVIAQIALIVIMANSSIEIIHHHCTTDAATGTPRVRIIKKYHHRKSSVASSSSSSSSSSSLAFVMHTQKYNDFLIPSQTVSSRLLQRKESNRKCSERKSTTSSACSNVKLSPVQIPLSLVPSQSVNSVNSVNSRMKRTTLNSLPYSNVNVFNEDDSKLQKLSSTSLSLSSSSLSLSSSSFSESYNDKGKERGDSNGMSTMKLIEDIDDEAGDTIIINDSKAGKNYNNTVPTRTKQKSASMKYNSNFTNEHTQRNRNNNGKNSTTLNTNHHRKTYSSKKQQQKKKKEYQYSFRYTGNLPDIHWRAIPMKHLRSHPNYQPLPLPKSITRISTLEDVRYFRQDSWQWDMLHSGRCTTSQAAPALGLLEGNAAKHLGIPKSLQKGCMGAYVRLGQSALRTLEEMNAILCNHGDDDCDEVQFSYYSQNDEEEEEEGEYEWYYDDKNGNTKSNQFPLRRRINIWKRMQKNRFPFAAKYSPQISMEELYNRRKQTKSYMSTLSSPMRIRMNWGNSQEATAILTALNYFYSIDPGVKVKEVGMCGAGLKYNSTTSSTMSSADNHDDEEESGEYEYDLHELILGASPDAVIEYSNGTLEVLEVKNHCPFVPIKKQSRCGESDNIKEKSSNSTKSESRARGNYRIREMPMHATVPPAYIPQLMMEMLCLGEECRSAVMCRQTATNGAILVRLRRDDEWINEMIYWLEKFVEDYVKEGTPPPRNFFWFDEDENVCERYQRFVQRTKELSDEVELVKYIQHGSIQRVLGKRSLRMPLFLD